MERKEIFFLRAGYFVIFPLVICYYGDALIISLRIFLVENILAQGTRGLALKTLAGSAVLCYTMAPLGTGE
jgi:hypothetical protein